jgi:L-ascorbate metabolism protein UlaG (beta-lactamase superfamily)
MKQQVFQNLYPNIPRRNYRELLKWVASRKPGHVWQKTKVEPTIPSHERVGHGNLHVTFVNHSTVLLQIDNLNILTDPIWSERCSPLQFAGPKRYCNPGIDLHELPPVDIVLLSHNHYDHTDLPTLRKIQKTHNPVFCVALGNKKFLERKGLKNVHEFDWWHEKAISEGVNIHFVPAQHFTRRGLFDENKTLWGGFVLKVPSGIVFFAGDTGYGTHFAEIRKKCGTPDFALLPIGAYLPRRLMQPVHMSPEDAVIAHLDLQSKQSMGIHFGTFQLGDEGPHQAAKDLQLALHKFDVPIEQFVALPNGGTLQLKL